jgi:hypothetical protein
MAINQNHLAEELNGIKTSVAERNVSRERAEFLKKILEFNGYTVVVAPSPTPKQVPAATVQDDQPVSTPTPPAQETFTVGVTDMMFNPINALFGRLLKAPGGHVVTLAYWQQKEKESHDDIPYFDKP